MTTEPRITSEAIAEARAKRKLPIETIGSLLRKCQRTIQSDSNFDLTDEDEYKNHANMLITIANIMLQREGRTFEVDDHNKDVLRFLLLYFNGSKDAEKVFPNEEYKLRNNLLLIGESGVGKTLLMQVFSEYLRLTESEKAFENISATQVMNYYKMHSHIDKYTYNEAAGGLEGKPFAVCLNDLGLGTETAKSFGTSLTQITDEFLFARYEIFQQRGVNYHITSNLSVSELKSRFDSRLVDRFRCFNVLELHGASRRK